MATFVPLITRVPASNSPLGSSPSLSLSDTPSVEVGSAHETHSSSSLPTDDRFSGPTVPTTSSPLSPPLPSSSLPQTNTHTMVTRSKAGIFKPKALSVEANQAIWFGAELGFLRSDIEGDALSVIKKIQSEEDDRSEIRAYILDAKRLKSYFISCRFRHAWRQMNKVAHLLAKEGLGMEEDTYLRNDLPRSVARAVEENRRDGRSA
ncbi:hypothetical protein Godav_004052 [Gossypium davidsonii]|uniref:RNase H type-1 domain-containing protein n=1 Tax=Gossypium davidsonii TaxID=34287 RepID=A0A7J8SJS2_GOSDV|nr:hypothetical protein [Gossypium davidsonii]